MSVDAALLLPPYYFADMTEEGLDRWLRQVMIYCQWCATLANTAWHNLRGVSSAAQITCGSFRWEKIDL